jgi:hypothetical protein
MTATLTVVEMIQTRASVWLAVAIGVPVWILIWVFFALLVKRRFGQRPDAASHPLPTYRRLWSRASDRVLFWSPLSGTVAGLAWAGDLAARSWAMRFLAVLVLAADGWWVSTAWAERRRRRRETG